MTKAQVTKAPTAEKLIYRIRSNADQVSKARDDLKKASAVYKKAKRELWANVYLYVERIKLDGGTRKLAYDNLTAEVGKSNGYWGTAYANGMALRDWPLADTAVPSSIAAAVQVVRPTRINPAHIKPLADLLNKGVGPTEVRRKMLDLGYPVSFSTMPISSTHKKKWTDWRRDIQRLAKSMLSTSVGQHEIEMIVMVDGEVVVDETVRSEREEE